MRGSAIRENGRSSLAGKAIWYMEGEREQNAMIERGKAAALPAGTHRRHGEKDEASCEVRRSLTFMCVFI